MVYHGIAFYVTDKDTLPTLTKPGGHLTSGGFMYPCIYTHPRPKYLKLSWLAAKTELMLLFDVLLRQKVWYIAFRRSVVVESVLDLFIHPSGLGHTEAQYYCSRRVFLTLKE